MKKYFVLLLILFIPFIEVKAQNLIDVSLVKCVDGDTATFKINNENVKFRFLAIDTPETLHPTKGEEEGGKKASEYTCERLTTAKRIQIAYDEKGTKTDKYGRGLAWIYVDGKLFQEELVEKGYAEVSYIYAKYEFVDHLCEVQRKAISEHVGIWSTNREEGYCKIKSNGTTKKTKTNKTTKKKNDDDLASILEDMIDSTTCIPVLIILSVLLIIVKTKKGSKKK